MHLIIGGAYQGKTDYALRLGLERSDVFTCAPGQAPEWGYKCLRHLENYALFCLRRGKRPEEEIFAHREAWRESVLICNDISCGVVPLEAEDRAWREATGRMLAALSREAETVTRLFCGLPQRLK